MRLIFATLLGVFVGFLQIIVIFAIEANSSAPRSIDPNGIVYPIAGFLIFLEGMGIILLAVYRVTPWLLRLLRADSDQHRVLVVKYRYHHWVERVVIASTALRRAIVMIHLGAWSFDLFFSLVIALMCLLIPLRREKLKDLKVSLPNDSRSSY